MADLVTCFQVAFGVFNGSLQRRASSIRLKFLEHLERQHDCYATPMARQDDGTAAIVGVSNDLGGFRLEIRERAEIFTVHFTPTSASWLNAVEGWFAQLERREIYRNSFASVDALRQELRRFIKVHNDVLAKPFRWTKSANAIIKKVERVRKELAN